jgi:hypothetical protein
MLGRKITWLIDGTEQPTHACGLPLTDYDLYSVKKKQHSLTIVLVVALDRTILWASQSYGGSHTDITITREELFKWVDALGEDENGLGDSGFKGSCPLPPYTLFC